MKKKIWLMPECKKIKLVPEEAVLLTCKTNDNAGPSGSLRCTGGGGGAPCQGGGFS